MGLQYNFHSTSAIPATAVVVDLRNFTPNLGAAQVRPDGVNDFCAFLAEFHAICLDACRVSIPIEHQDTPPFLLWSTGDGVIACFTDSTFHVQHAYLASLIMQGVLRNVCKEYNQSRKLKTIPAIGFGIGMETGEVWAVHVARRRRGTECPHVLGAMHQCCGTGTGGHENTASCADDYWPREQSTVGSRTIGFRL